MTREQEREFLSAAKLGMAMGVEHPLEWYENAIAHDSWMPYDKVDEYERSVLDAFVAFYRDCGSCPGDPWETLTEEQFLEMVSKHYEH